MNLSLLSKTLNTQWASCELLRVILGPVNHVIFSLCEWVFALPAVSHHIAVRRLDEDVVHVEQNVHEVFPSHGAAICVPPLALQKKQKKQFALKKKERKKKNTYSFNNKKNLN